eukprot:15447524-Alexandrium_andersonii.AAC.1
MSGQPIKRGTGTVEGATAPLSGKPVNANTALISWASAEAQASRSLRMLSPKRAHRGESWHALYCDTGWAQGDPAAPVACAAG